MLLFHVQRNQLPWFKHLTRIPPVRRNAQNISLWVRCSGHVIPGGGLRSDSGDAGEITSLGLPWNTSVLSQISSRKWLGKGSSRLLSLNCCPIQSSSDFSLFLVLLQKTSVIIQLMNSIIQLLGMFESSTFLHIRFDNINCCLCPDSQYIMSASSYALKLQRMFSSAN